MSLENLKKQITKNVKGTHCDILSKSDIAEINEWISSPTHALNRVISGDLYKGTPEKTLTLCVGEEATFKSTMMTLSMTESMKKGYTGVYVDTEGAISHEWMERWGVDINNVLYIYEPFVDSVTSILGQLLDSEDEKFFICIDSLGNLESKKLEEDSIAGDVKSDQGQLARKIKRMMKMLLAVVKKKKSIAIVGGHFYSSPGAYVPIDQIQGGKSVRLCPHIILSLKKAKMINGKGKDSRVIGNEIKVTSIKNRFYPAFEECSVYIDYQNGINKKGDLVPLALETGLMERGGAWYTNTVTGEKVQGEAKAETLINDELLEELNKLLKHSGYSNVNNELKQQIDLIETVNEETMEEGEEE